LSFQIGLQKEGATMTRNMGFVDRLFRFASAIVIAIRYMLGFSTATWAVWLFGVIGTMMLVQVAYWL
jgi:hypothetical protein